MQIFYLSSSKEYGLFTHTFSFSKPHTYKSLKFKSGDHEGHNPQLMTSYIKTLSKASTELFTVYAIALSCRKGPQDFSLPVS
jgi:hypothetical protein